MKFVRPDIPDATQVQTLSEGIPINVFRNTTLTFITATMAQFGEAIKISDVLGWTQLFDTLEIGVKQLGQDAALHADTQIRNVLVAGSTTKRYSGTTSWANLAAGTAAAGSCTITDMLDCMTKLTINRAPKLNSEYVMVVAPAVARDLMNDAKFVLAGQYGTAKGFLKGEVGMFYGIRVVVATNPFTEDGTAGAEGTFAAAGGAKDIYVSFALGTDAFGIPLMAGQSPFDPTVYINNRPDKSDILNQFTAAGWKAYWVSVVLNPAWIVALRSRTSFA